MYPFIAKVIRFLVSGTTAAAVNVGTLFVLVHYLGVYYLIASILAFLTSVALGFTLQRFWTFRDRASGPIHRQFAGYAVVTTMNLGINTIVVYVLVEYAGVWYLLAQIAGGLLIAVTGYLAYHFFVFTPASAQSE
jgi:dolichol-phosphate mannosyltransferase